MNSSNKEATTGLLMVQNCSRNLTATATEALISGNCSPSTTSSARGTSTADNVAGYLGGLYFTCFACFEEGAHHSHYYDPGTYNLCCAAIAIRISLTTTHTSWITTYCYAPKEAILLMLHHIW
ncbi:hypothetical protein M0R45_000103 [Rubus argutus]|uniref:Uncharacterized protein n=1 Tax=Rubus argutus TaxID=59490 RepID=A0AAW1VQ62_RUBAR